MFFTAEEAFDLADTELKYVFKYSTVETLYKLAIAVIEFIFV